MKIAALQTVSTPDVSRNLESAARLIDQAARQGAQLLALPEYFCLMGASDHDKLTHAEAAGSGPIQSFLAQQARDHGVWIIGGTVPISTTTPPTTSPTTAPPERVRNACCVYAPNGHLAARYDKLHLFRYDNGRESYDEARVLEAGNQPVAVQCGALRVGLSICYDLRFPELYRQLCVPPCDLIAVPAAFTHTTGRAHWELLLRARAVENQCYVLAAAQGGQHENGRRTWGHSMVIDPWGEVLAVWPEGEGVVVAEVDAQRLNAVRQQLPALAHRRL